MEIYSLVVVGFAVFYFLLRSDIYTQLLEERNSDILKRIQEKIALNKKGVIIDYWGTLETWHKIFPETLKEDQERN